jgi:hypothetical protein
VVQDDKLKYPTHINCALCPAQAGKLARVVPYTDFPVYRCPLGHETVVIKGLDK